MTVAVTFAVALTSVTVADEPESIESTSFETAPSAFWRGSVDVLSVAVAPQGEHVCAAFHDGSVTIFDRTTRQPIAVEKCHSGPVSDLAISDSGELLVTGSYDGTVRTWKIPSLDPVATMSGHSGRVVDVALSPDARTIASCGYDKTIRIWDAGSKAERAALTGHEATVRAVAFAPDGTILASAGDDGFVRLWNVEGLNEIGTRNGHDGRVRDVVFSPDGKTLASVGEDGAILLWSVSDADATPERLNHGAMIWSVAFSPRGSLIASGDADGSVDIWDIETGQITSSLEGHTDTITSLTFAADSKSLISSSHDGTVNVWSAKQPPHPALAQIEVAAGKVWATAVSPESSTIAVGGRRGFVQILDLTTGKQVAELDGHPATVDCLEFSRDGRLIATGGWRSKEVIVWQADDGAQKNSFEADGNIRSIAFSPNGKRLAAGCDDQLLVVWDIESGDLVKKTMLTHSRFTTCLILPTARQSQRVAATGPSPNRDGSNCGRPIRSPRLLDWMVTRSPSGRPCSIRTEVGWHQSVKMV
jgi:WD40 repeat protein